MLYEIIIIYSQIIRFLILIKIYRTDKSIIFLFEPSLGGKSLFFVLAAFVRSLCVALVKAKLEVRCHLIRLSYNIKHSREHVKFWTAFK